MAGILNNRKKDFINALRTESGMRILKYLQEDELSKSAIRQQSELTHYFLGRKELVEELIRTSKLDEKDLEPIRTINDYDNDEVYRT